MNSYNPHDARTMMGFVAPGDQRVALPIRDWEALKLALWRSSTGWEIIRRSTIEIIEHCRHADGCLGKEEETAACLPDCPDRETRMSALVALNAARMFAPIDARRPADQPYFAPSREYYSEMWAALVVAHAELDAFRAAGGQVSPPPNGESLPIHKELKEAT